MIDFKGKILVIGYGSVSKCTLPMLLDNVNIRKENITIMDLEDKSRQLDRWTGQGIRFVQKKLTKETFDESLSSLVGPGDMIIDLAWNISTIDFLRFCNEHDILYTNASFEEWDPYADQETKTAYQKSLYIRHMLLRKIAPTWKKQGATAILDHGANPGLISHFVKQGLLDIAKKVAAEKKAAEKELIDIQEYAEKKDFARLALALGVKVIHCSERDTQLSHVPKKPNEFVNTWSIDGLHEECIGPSELGWGTHEKRMPEEAELPPEGPMNQIFLKRSGMDTWVYSFVPPDHEIIGMVIRHGEAFTISERLTVFEDGKAVYRPTVHYAYNPCDAAIASLNELRGRNYIMQDKKRIYTDDEICEGSDILGALIMGHAYNSWWTGSELSIDEAKKLVPGQNATTIQVAAGVLASVLWMIKNPKEGINVPDDLPHDFVLEVAKPYLGNFISDSYDWTPLKGRVELFPKGEKNKDPWQFETFLYPI